MSMLRGEELTADIIQGVLVEFGNSLKGVRAVEVVELGRNGDILEIQTIGNHLSESDENKIYAAEKTLYKRYPSINLDFSLLDRADRQLVDSNDSPIKYLMTLRTSNTKETERAVA